MKRLSSNTTLFLKIFLPVFWLVFYGSFTLSFWLLDPATLPLLTSWTFRILFTLFYVLGTVFLYFTFFQLKRVEIDADFIYVSNYFKTYRYPFHRIEQLSQKNYLVFKTTQIHFKEEQSFGKAVSFIARRGIWEELAQNIPELLEDISMR